MLGLTVTGRRSLILDQGISLYIPTVCGIHNSSIESPSSSSPMASKPGQQAGIFTCHIDTDVSTGASPLLPIAKHIFYAHSTLYHAPRKVTVLWMAEIPHSAVMRVAPRYGLSA